MKQGKSLTQLAQTLEDIKNNSKDFLVPTAKLTMTDDNKLSFVNGTDHAFEPNNYSHGQIASYVDIPKKYYERLQTEAPQLLAQNVNHGFGKLAETTGKNNRPENRMVRTYNGKMRAFLSSSYRRLDSFDLCDTVLPTLIDNKLQVHSAELTEQRLYIKALSPKLESEVAKGDVVQYGLVISNSDVGAGSVRIEPLIYRLVCLNGMIANSAIKKFHIGRNQAGDDITELLSTSTLDISDQAFWMQVNDVLLASMRPENFEREVNRLREAANVPIKNFDLPEVVELSMRAVNISGEQTKQSILSYLANGADGAHLTKWGLANAFTYAAQQDHVSYDSSIELERAGSRIIDLGPKEWRKVAETA